MERQFEIRDLAERTGITPHTLRYYERAGLMKDVPRASNGRRVYDETHVRWVGMLRRLRAVGMPIARMREYVEMARRGADTLEARARLLEEHGSALEEQRRELEEFLEILERKVKLHRERQPGADCLTK